MLNELNLAHNSARGFRGVLNILASITLAAWIVQGACHLFFKTPYYQDAANAAGFCVGLAALYAFIQSLIDHAITRRVFIESEIEHFKLAMQIAALREATGVDLTVSAPANLDPAAITAGGERTRTALLAALSGDAPVA